MGLKNQRRHRTMYLRVGLPVVVLVVVAIAALSAGADEIPHRAPSFTAEAQIQSAPEVADPAPGETIDLVVDTDAGVDDAAALVWLLEQDRYPVNLLGVTTVAGNSTVDNVTNNVLILLEAAGRTDIPVTIGAAEPREQELTKSTWLLHGPDGLWFVGLQNPHDLSGLPTGAPEFYRDMALAHPGATLLALGPLTNLAAAVESYPDQMALYGEIVILGGARNGGNSTPVSEFNIWQDPEAAEIVFTAGLPISLVTLDAFSEFTIDQEDLDELQTEGTAAAQFLAVPLQIFADGQFARGAESVALPDVAATMFALKDALAQASQSALVKVVPGPELVRGQTVIGLGLQERVSMIASDEELSDLAVSAFYDPEFNLEAELGAILMREPDNATVVLDLKERQIHRFFMRELTR
mgnify:CR=1 FL=1